MASGLFRSTDVIAARGYPNYSFCLLLSWVNIDVRVCSGWTLMSLHPSSLVSLTLIVGTRTQTHVTQTQNATLTHNTSPTYTRLTIHMTLIHTRLTPTTSTHTRAHAFRPMRHAHTDVPSRALGRCAWRCGTHPHTYDTYRHDILISNAETHAFRYTRNLHTTITPKHVFETHATRTYRLTRSGHGHCAGEKALDISLQKPVTQVDS